MVHGGQRGDASEGGGWSQLPNLQLSDLALMLWRERWLMAAVGAGVLAIGTAFIVFRLETTYEADARVLVLLDDSYSPNPVVGEQSRQSFQTQETVQAEIALLQSNELKNRVLRTPGFGPSAIYPRLTARGNENAARLEGFAARLMSRNFWTVISPNSPAIDVYFRHEDPDMSAMVLNQILDEYQDFRREQLLDFDERGLGAERDAAEARLLELNREIQALLAANDIGDFDGERAAAQERGTTLADALLAAQAAREAAESQLGALARRAEETPAEITLYVDDSASERLQTLLVERDELLSRYLPESRPVQAVERRIAQLQASLQEGGVEGGLTRRGVNPVRQALDTQRLQLEAEVASMRRREAALTRQLDENRARQIRIQELAPEFDRVARERAALESTVRSLAEREEAGRTRQAIARDENDNVRIIQRAIAPIEGSSPRRLAFVALVLLAGLSALAAGLLRGVLRKVAPTRSSAARTLGVPILAVIDADAVAAR